MYRDPIGETHDGPLAYIYYTYRYNEKPSLRVNLDIVKMDLGQTLKVKYFFSIPTADNTTW